MKNPKLAAKKMREIGEDFSECSADDCEEGELRHGVAIFYVGFYRKPGERQADGRLSSKLFAEYDFYDPDTNNPAKFLRVARVLQKTV